VSSAASAKACRRAARRWSLDAARADVVEALSGEPQEADERVNLDADRLGPGLAHRAVIGRHLREPVQTGLGAGGGGVERGEREGADVVEALSGEPQEADERVNLDADRLVQFAGWGGRRAARRTAPAVPPQPANCTSRSASRLTRSSASCGSASPD
jgi:hypothetical protein